MPERAISSLSPADLIRGSIPPFARACGGGTMDCRVKPGNDSRGEARAPSIDAAW